MTGSKCTAALMTTRRAAQYSGSNQSTIAEPATPKTASDRGTLLRLTAA
jgi:hypothetical protein